MLQKDLKQHAVSAAHCPVAGALLYAVVLHRRVLSWALNQWLHCCAALCMLLTVWLLLHCCGAQACVELGVERVVAQGDSKLVIMQVGASTKRVWSFLIVTAHHRTV
jgi:hypothetical protein